MVIGMVVIFNVIYMKPQKRTTNIASGSGNQGTVLLQFQHTPHFPFWLDVVYGQMMTPGGSWQSIEYTEYRGMFRGEVWASFVH